MKSVYLAGSINGELLEDAVDWRQYVGQALTNKGYNVLDPMRFKNALPADEIICDSNTVYNPKYIFERDIDDVNRADFIVFNLATIGTLPCIGTLFELGYYYNSVQYSGSQRVKLVNVPIEFNRHPFLEHLTQYDNFTGLIDSFSTQ